MSVGNTTQAVNFDRTDLTLVLGENLDLGGDDSGARNGTGKCFCINTLVRVRNTITGDITELTIGELYNDTVDQQSKPMPTLSTSITRKFIDSLDLTNLEIETDDAFKPITAIHKTIPYVVWDLETERGLTLSAADTHILFDHTLSEIFVKDIIPNKTKICTKHGIQIVTKITNTLIEENMFDVTVNSANHRFYSNDILSHNTTIINALSYAFYGTALTNIRKDNLINKTNQKNMMVTIDFEKDGESYRIERSRRPNTMKFWVGDQEKEITDDAQGDSRETQADIERMLGMSHDMFKHIVALNTYTEPFLALKANDQRTIIEQLLGITLLSEKADKLKEQNKSTKDDITKEEFRIKAVTDANVRIQEQIENLKRRQTLWTNKHNEDVNKLEAAIDQLLEIDVDLEIMAHKALALYLQTKKDIVDIQSLIARAKQDESRESRAVDKLSIEISKLEDHQCHTCGQEFHDEKHIQVLANKQQDLEHAVANVETAVNDVAAFAAALVNLGELGTKPETFYANEEDAIHHRLSVASLQQQLAVKGEEADPYIEQIAEMQTQGIEEITYNAINDLTNVKDHQEFLLKLLTNKDSFIRKRIIDQNLSYLNARLGQYLDRIGLPHTIKFNNDLTVSITELGRDLDFYNLSRGEMNRLILSLSLSFRDVWESLYQPINLLFIDELVDSGMDSSGVENCLAILKKISRESNKSIWLVSHKDELVSRVGNVLKAVKENGYTHYATDYQTN